MHFLRSKDRKAHGDSYPMLYYPEMYLLHGGYKVSCSTLTFVMCMNYQLNCGLYYRYLYIIYYNYSIAVRDDNAFECH